MPSNYDYIPGAQGTRNSLQGGSSITSAGRPVAQPYGNRYIPPTFNFGRDPGGGRPNYDQMDWNNIQGYNLPQQGNNPYQQEYMGGLRDMLSSFQGRYPQQQPRMPQFGGGDPYNMHDPGDMSYYDQRYGQQGRDDNAAFMANGGSTPRGGRQGGYDYESQQPGFDTENYGPGSLYEYYARQRLNGGRQDGNFGGGGGLSRFGGGRGGFDPRALMAQLFGGMSPEQMFSGGNYGQQQRPRPKYPDFNSGYGTGGAGPESGMVTKPLRMGGGG